MSEKLAQTEEYYIASIDLLGTKKLIKNDLDDKKLNQARNIYMSWPRILNDGYFQDMKIRFFSDNVVVALKSDNNGAVDKLLETVGWICKHFLQCGFKPRGGICRGKFYIDDIFVWGSGLVDAYIIESREAIFPRIVVSEEVALTASKHISDWMLFDDDDGKICLNYLKSFGSNREDWIMYITAVMEWLIPEYEDYNSKEKCSNEDEEIKKKLKWLVNYVNENKSFWDHCCES